jgi:hypothetical protein
MEELSNLIYIGNKDEIHPAIEMLNAISRYSAKRQVDEAVNKAMKGKIV